MTTHDAATIEQARTIWADACERNGHYTYARYLRSGQSPSRTDEMDDSEALFDATMDAISTALRSRSDLREAYLAGAMSMMVGQPGPGQRDLLVKQFEDWSATPITTAGDMG